uniref:glucose-1-phosphate adenylyltransferase n=1 Tax=Davidia involucrata TaxID=16924 RepID=A0A5B6YYW3_DAVIN
MANNNSQMAGTNSHFELRSLEERSVHELEDESLVSHGSVIRKTQSLDAAPQRSFSIAGSEDFDRNYVLNSMLRSIKVVLFSAKINLLVPCGFLAILVDLLTSHHGWVFLLSLLGIIPLAERLGWATEQLAFYTGATVGGLLNATFGNATELIISIHAMRSGMIRVVQQSLLGSILSNMLLVLGCAFFSGGIVHSNKEQVFNKSNAVMNSGLLLMAVMGLLFPAVLHSTHTELHFGKSELALSRFSSCIMLVAYAAYLFFQLKSENNLYAPVNKVQAYLYDGYWEDIGTIEAFYNANLGITKKPVPDFSFYDRSSPIYTQPRYLPPSKMLDADVTDSVIGEGCVIKNCKIHHSVVGLRSCISEGAIIEDSLLMGADYYETDADRRFLAAKGSVPIGIGKNSHIKRAIIDKNARIGDNVKIINSDNVQEAARETDGYFIKSGIVTVIKDALVPSGTVI